MKRPALQNKQVVVLRMAFRARKVFGTFEKRAPGVTGAVVCHVLSENYIWLRADTLDRDFIQLKMNE